MKKAEDVTKRLDKLISLLCAALTGIQLFGYVTGIFPAMQQRSLFLGIILSITLLIHIRNKLSMNIIDLWSIFVLAVTVFASVYVFTNWYGMSFRVIRPNKLDLIVGRCI